MIKESTIYFLEILKETSRKQKQFLTQFLGGPDLYTQEHGHPMLKKDIWNLELLLMKEMHG